MGIFAGVLLLFAAVLPQQSKDAEFSVLWDKLKQCTPATGEAMLLALEERVKQCEDPGVKRLLELGKRARRELETRPDPGLKCYDAKPHVPGLKRKPLPREGSAWKEAYDDFRPWENYAQFFVRLRYDFGQDRAVVMRPQLPVDEAIWNYLNGYPPDADALLAWLESKFDHDQGLNATAEHFGHLYCDRDGGVFEEITLYDAMASGETIEMPDLDVLEYFRHVRNDKKHKAPLPAALHDQLYEQVKDGFLPYFRHRTLVETAAHLYLNPEAWIRDGHEAMRENILWLIAHEEEDAAAIGAFLKEQGDRGGLMDGTLELSRQHPTWYKRKDRWVQERNASRWAIAQIAQSVLEEFGFATSVVGR